MLEVYIVIAAVLACSGVVLAACMQAFKRLPESSKLHNRQNPEIMRGPASRRMAVVNSLVSTSMFFGFAAVMGERLIRAGDTPAWRIALEIVGGLLLYDFLYYFLHRDVFHRVRRLIKVHAVHHTGKWPTAADSFYIHPLETFLGVGVLLLTLVLVGPIHLASFALILLLYTSLNITVHSGLALRTFPLNLLNYMARKHDIHHKGMRAGNYASITPLPDLLFGTMNSDAREGSTIR